MSDAAVTMTCVRCRKTGTSRARSGVHDLLPEGWMGSPNDAVCPGCQIAGWVAHCTSLVDGDGDRVDLNAIPRAEWAVETLMGCGWIDQSRTYVDNESPDAAWRCPQCGGSGVELVKPDYNEPRSGVA